MSEPVIINTNEDMLNYAFKQAQKMGAIRNSIRKGKGNYAGFVGEAAVRQFFGFPLELNQNTYNFDIIFDNTTYDIKSKQTTVVPKPDYEVSVCDKNTFQDCSAYLFSRVYWPSHSEDPLKVYLVGWYPKNIYYEKAVFCSKGGRSLSNTNDFVVKEDCWNMYHKDLLDVRDILSRARSVSQSSL